ncbi:DUF1630-domain-containing protein [Irpex rosettiformis]|uniref:DUF1630-domain-containing protein n=1 Tax=Irpex rosettiformis TaxID=378272 RepID=A0ACB8TYW9_9APHY|nr:DUF1630-domain-containing protein [Irpex rosettiformis]
MITIVRDEEKTPFKSSSNPNLLNVSPKVSMRRLSRSNTLPRMPRLEVEGGATLDDLSTLSMEPSKVTRLRRWIISLVVVDFDIDYGPKVTGIYPPLQFSAQEESNIAFSSFPDSPQAESGSYIHSFRIRCPASVAQAAMDEITPGAEVDGFIYGFAHFTQRRDPKSKRGYQQRSLVILSQHAYPSLFYSMSSYLGEEFLSHGGPMLEVACHNVANWPDPHPSTTLELGFLGYVFTTDLPEASGAQLANALNKVQAKPDPYMHIIATLAPQQPPIIDALQSCLAHLWSIWECLILCEPILVFGTSAAMASQVVWWLRGLLHPIPLAGDFRPFFTIHDSDHSTLVNCRAPQAGLLLGVTNPFFNRACSHWPHVLSVGPSKKKATQGSANISGGPPLGWTTKTHKRHVSKDLVLLRKLQDALHRDERAQLEASEALREHLTSRTTAFLVPLQRYLNTLIPTHADPAPTPFPPARLKPFNENAFFASLKANGSPLPFKRSAKRKDFYEKWMRTRAFGLWLAGQEEVVNRVLSEPPSSALLPRTARLEPSRPQSARPVSPSGSVSSG